MAEITFDSRYDAVEFLNPMKGFAPERQRLEMRWDPLLRHCSLYNPALEKGLKTFIGDADRPLLERIAAETAGNCIFCPERIESTARFPETFIAEGRLKAGEATLFPNILGLAPYHAVIAVSHAHWLPPAGFSPRLLRDAFKTAREYIAAVFDADAEATHASVNANYLFPAGASLFHPHFQVLVSNAPYTHQQALLEACNSYLDEHGSGYFEDLLVTERRIGERHIGQTGPWNWLASYSPLAANEIMGIHAGSGDFTDMAEDDLEGLAEGLAGVLRCYAHLNYFAFNFSLYARRRPDTHDGFTCLIRLMTRQNPYANYRADDFFLQKALESELILTRPERLAEEARAFVGKG